MTRHTVLPPFLQKLKNISQTIPADIACWADDGLSYIVKDSDKFEIVLKQHFKGNLQTFVRQLHFYGFRKLDAQNGGWSFAHKNFQKDKPDLLAEIRRKTRGDSPANGMATQVEVQQLRSQVAKLQDVVDELRTQLDSVLGVLDDVGVVEVSKSKEGKPLTVKAPVKIKVEQQQHIPDSTSRKRTRMEGGGIDDDFMTIEPLALEAALDEHMMDSMDVNESDNFYNELKLNFPAAISEEEASCALDNNSKMDMPLPGEEIQDENALLSSNNATAKIVADATELDPKSVQKVLGFLKKAAMNADSSSSATSPEKENIQNAIRIYKDFGDRSLPELQIGAN